MLKKLNENVLKITFSITKNNIFNFVNIWDQLEYFRHFSQKHIFWLEKK